MFALNHSYSDANLFLPPRIQMNENEQSFRYKPSQQTAVLNIKKTFSLSIYSIAWHINRKIQRYCFYFLLVEFILPRRYKSITDMEIKLFPLNFCDTPLLSDVFLQAFVFIICVILIITEIYFDVFGVFCLDMSAIRHCCNYSEVFILFQCISEV